MGLNHFFFFFAIDLKVKLNPKSYIKSTGIFMFYL